MVTILHRNLKLFWPMLVKVCGLRDAENVRGVGALHPDMAGFIFYPASVRNACGMAEDIPAMLPSGVRRVGVFVNEKCSAVLDTAGRYGLDMVQMHGEETPQECSALKEKGLSVIKAMGISDVTDMWTAARYDGACDYLLFDTKSFIRGGTGERFDWGLLEGYKGKTPFFISGGISPGIVSKIARVHHPMFCGVDVNSRFETSPGIKDAALLEKFIKQIRNIKKDI